MGGRVSGGRGGGVRAFLPPIISGEFGSRSKWNNKKKKMVDRSISALF